MVDRINSITKILEFFTLLLIMFSLHPWTRSQHGIPEYVTQHGFDGWGLPTTGGIAMGIAIGFMKG